MTALAAAREYQPLPHAPDAERAALGAVLVNNDLVKVLIAELKANDFYLPQHRAVFRAVRALTTAGCASIDAVTVAEQMRRDSSSHTEPTYTLLTELTYGLPRLTSIDDYVALIREQARLRELLRFANEITSRAQTGGETAQDIALWLNREAAGIAERANGAHNSSLFVCETMNQWMRDAQAKPIPRALFSEFWAEGEVAIFFGDTGIGKSILAVQLADSISRGRAVEGFTLEAARQRVLYFDFELSDKQQEKRYSKDYLEHY